MTELEKWLPELNPAQLKWLNRYIAEQRAEELSDTLLWQSGMAGPIIDRIEDRIATLRKEAGE